MNKIAAIKKLNDTELDLAIAGTPASWHQKYLQCDAIYIGGLPDTFKEQDLLAVLEQYGIVLHVNLVRDSNTNASRGFAFVKYADPRSCILAIDNLNGFEIDGRSLRLDHADDYHDKGGTGLDTTPPGFHVPHETPSRSAERKQGSQATTVELNAEKRRENAVLDRLEQLRKKRRMNVTEEPKTDAIEVRLPSATQPREPLNEPKTSLETPHPDSTEKKQRRAEKERRRREKELRKEERARIRKERAERRAARQNAP